MGEYDQRARCRGIYQWKLTKDLRDGCNLQARSDDKQKAEDRGRQVSRDDA